MAACRFLLPLLLLWVGSASTSDLFLNSDNFLPRGAIVEERILKDVSVPLIDPKLEGIAKDADVLVLDKDDKGKMRLVKPPKPPKQSFLQTLKKFFKGKKDKKTEVKKKIHGECRGEKCQLDLYNYDPYPEAVKVGVSAFDDLFEAEVEVDKNLDASVGISACGAVCSIDSEKVTAGGGLPGAVPIVKFSYEGIYSTADGKWIGKVVKGGLNFVFFSTEHVKVYQHGEEVKNLSKVSILGVSYVRAEEKVGDKLIPVTKDVYFTISSPTPVIKVSLNKSLSQSISGLFENFGKDWYGEYKMDGKHKDIEGIVAGGELAVPKKESTLKKRLKKFFGFGKKKASEESPVQLLSIRKFDPIKGEFVTIDASTLDVKPPADPFASLTQEELLSVAHDIPLIAFPDTKPKTVPADSAPPAVAAAEPKTVPADSAPLAVAEEFQS